MAMGHTVSAIAGSGCTIGATAHSAADSGSTTTAKPLERANHFICWRSTPDERRSRFTAATSAATRATALRVRPTANNVSVGRPGAAYGLRPPTKY